jgi:ABC-type glycerol-3-phosphate transport system substrate-binding protein
LSPDGTEPAITKPNAIEAIKAIVSIYKNGIAPLSSTDISSFSFQAGNVAMSQDGNWAVGDLAKNYPDVKYMAQELPIPDGGDPVNCVFGGWQPCFTPTFAQSDEDTKRGALLWMEYFGSSKAMTLLYTDYGVFPTRKSTLEQIPNTNMSPQVAQFKNLMATKTRARETNVRYTDITTAFLEEMQNAIYKDVPVETAMKSADERLRSIMSKKS